MVEPRTPAVAAALVAQALQQLPLLLRVREHDAALAGRELLVRVEAESSGDAVPSDGATLVLGAERLGRVLDQREPVPLADRADLVELARVAEHVDRDDRLRPLGDRRLERGRVDVERARIDVHEHGGRSLEDEAVGRGHEGDRRRDRLVARPEAGDARQEMQARGRARDGGRVGRADPLRDHLLEALDRRPEREPAGTKHLEDELLLPLVQQRTRERYLADAGAQASAGVGVA